MSNRCSSHSALLKIRIPLHRLHVYQVEFIYQLDAKRSCQRLCHRLCDHLSCHVKNDRCRLGRLKIIFFNTTETANRTRQHIARTHVELEQIGFVEHPDDCFAIGDDIGLPLSTTTQFRFLASFLAISTKSPLPSPASIPLAFQSTSASAAISPALPRITATSI